MPTLIRDEIPREIVALLDDPDTSTWLRANLWTLLTRDPIDALNDSAALAQAMEGWARHHFRLAGVDLPI